MKDFFPYRTSDGRSGIIRTSEISRLCEIDADGATLRIFMKDGTPIDSLIYDLRGFTASVLEDDHIEELLKNAV